MFILEQSCDLICSLDLICIVLNLVDVYIKIATNLRIISRSVPIMIT